MNNCDNILLVLDLDETLIHSSPQELQGIDADFRIQDYWVYKRPFLNSFIESVSNFFRIAIWSSASDGYVETIVKQIIPLEYKTEFIWARTNCTLKRDYDLDNYYYVKPLKKLKNKGYKLERILIIDDSFEKSKENFGNAIYVKEFTGQPDDELKKLASYLETLKDIDNVRVIEKRNWYLKVK